MTHAIFFDTETTGLPLFKEPSEHQGQPHIAQLAACLVDTTTRKTVASMDVIIRPEDWTIPEEVTAIHGITTAQALAVGVPEVLAVQMLLALWARADFKVGHNESFDTRIVRIAQLRNPAAFSEAQAEAWKAGKAECTCYMARPHTKLEKNKLPKLGEAYRHFFGKELDGAHSAMADTQACMAIYFAMLDLRADQIDL